MNVFLKIIKFIPHVIAALAAILYVPSALFGAAGYLGSVLERDFGNTGGGQALGILIPIYLLWYFGSELKKKRSSDTNNYDPSGGKFSTNPRPEDVFRAWHTLGQTVSLTSVIKANLKLLKDGEFKNLEKEKCEAMIDATQRIQNSLSKVTRLLKSDKR